MNNSSFDITCFHRICWISAPVSYMLHNAGVVVSIFIFLTINVGVLRLGIKQAASTGCAASSDTTTLNQAAMELCNCLGYLLLLLDNVTCNAALNSTVGFFTICCLSGRSFFCASVCVERYVAVVHPLTYLSPKMNKLRVFSAGVNWVTSLACGVLAVTNVSMLIFFQVYFCTSIAIMVFCSFAMLKVLIRPKPGDRNSRIMDQNKRKSFLVITLILLFSLCGYVPYLVTYVVPSALLCEAITAATWLFIPNFLLPPLLYLCKAGRARRRACF